MERASGVVCRGTKNESDFQSLIVQAALHDHDMPLAAGAGDGMDEAMFARDAA